MSTIDFDVDYWRACIVELKDFLLSEQLFWPLSARPSGSGISFPQLTLGGMLLTRSRAFARAAQVERAALIPLDQEMGAVRDRWRSAWNRKAVREFTSRLRQWGNYLDDYRRNPEEQAGYFAQEVRLRVILALLQAEEIDLQEGEGELLEAMDKRLRANFSTGEFIWKEALTQSFPEDSYWYLYGQLANGPR
jgi:hypothetical protein